MEFGGPVGCSAGRAGDVGGPAESVVADRRVAQDGGSGAGAGTLLVLTQRGIWSATLPSVKISIMPAPYTTTADAQTRRSRS